jgi:hypothetical protein
MKPQNAPLPIAENVRTRPYAYLPETFYCVDDLAQWMNRNERGYFFSPDSMRLFGTSFPDSAFYQGGYFVTRERSRMEFGDPYVVRMVTAWTDDDRPAPMFATCGSYSTLSQARKRIAELQSTDTHKGE